MTTHRRPGKKAYLLITGFAVLLVLFPFLFWYSTWFGRKLSPADLDNYLAENSKPRRAQHALVQLGERMSRHQDSARWYPRIVALASHPSIEIRQTTAWIMGQDRNYVPFHTALVSLLRDPEPMVRRNAALSLAAFGDETARPELVAMLQPFTITAASAGRLKYRLKSGDYVNPGTLVGHVGDAEIRAPVPGEVRALEQKDGAPVHPGDPVAALSADRNHVWEALRALYLIGTPADIDIVDRFTHPIPGMPETVARQAELTLQAIRSRDVSR